MRLSCSQPIPWELLVDYAAGDLSDAETERIEEHLMSCSQCSEAASPGLAIAAAMREFPLPVLSPGEIEVLRARGMRVIETRILPGIRTPVTFASDSDILVHRLSGLDLRESESVHVTVRVESTREVLFEQPKAPFDREAGEVLMVCQRHFAVFPPDIEFEVRARQRTGEETTALFIVPHAGM